jgi:hypothetical protein
MSPRIQRLATDWKTYLALLAAVGSGLAALPEFFNKVKDAVRIFRDLPPETRWVAVALLGLLGLVALLAALSRRSVLLRPDRFLISSDDPRHLVGRDQEVKELCGTCEANSLVFLIGESGAGKSALVQAGLLPYYRAPAKPDAEPHRLLPVRIDTSALSWDDGLLVPLARFVASLSEQDRALLGAKEPLGSADLVSWLSQLSSNAPRRLLVVLDQIDDYFLAHRKHFLSGRKVIAPEELEKSNRDWAALAELVRKGHIHLLIICRDDAVLRDALHFKPATTYPLPRIDQRLISPLLDQITQDDGKSETVVDPAYGWEQLKGRLLSALSGSTQILPIQLSIALDSLRRFRYLTLAEFSKHGGARGLERMHIERHIRDAAKVFGIEDAALLRALTLLTTEDGSKTQRATLQKFTQSILGPAKKKTDFEPLVDHLERNRILRRQSVKEGEHLLLYHDYLARGVREVNRQANRWTELL